MPAIKQIQVDGVVYDIKAKQDIDGNDIVSTYVKKDGNKVLSTEDFTTVLKNKLDGIDNQANNYVLPAAGTSLGGVKQGVAVADASSELPEIGNVITQLNALLVSLRNAGIIATE